MKIRDLVAKHKAIQYHQEATQYHTSPIILTTLVQVSDSHIRQ